MCHDCNYLFLEYFTMTGPCDLVTYQFLLAFLIITGKKKSLTVLYLFWLVCSFSCASLLSTQEMDIEVDENGTLDLSMKKPIKREGSVSGTSPGVRSPDPSSSSSSSFHHSGNSGMTSPNLHTYKQEDWEGPLDFTKPNRQREEETDEVSAIKRPLSITPRFLLH